MAGSLPPVHSKDTTEITATSATGSMIIAAEERMVMCGGQMKEIELIMTTGDSEEMIIMVEESLSKIMVPASKDKSVQIIMAAVARITEGFIVRRNGESNRIITGRTIIDLSAVVMNEIMVMRQTGSFALTKTGHSHRVWKEDTNSRGNRSSSSHKGQNVVMNNPSRRGGSRNNLPVSLKEEMIMVDPQAQAEVMVAAMEMAEVTEEGLGETNSSILEKSSGQPFTGWPLLW